MTETETAYVEEYIARSVWAYLAVNEWLGIPCAGSNPKVKKNVDVTIDLDEEARNVRQVLGVAPRGPIGNLVSVVENLGRFLLWKLMMQRMDFLDAQPVELKAG